MAFRLAFPAWLVAQAVLQTVAAAVHLARRALALRRLGLVALVRLALVPQVVFLVLSASWQRERVAVLVAARLARRVVHRARSSIRRAFRAVAVSVAVLADARCSVTVAWAVRRRWRVRQRLLRLMGPVVVAVARTQRAVLDGREQSSLSGPLNAEGYLSRLPFMWGHA